MSYSTRIRFESNARVSACINGLYEETDALNLDGGCNEEDYAAAIIKVVNSSIIKQD